MPLLLITGTKGKATTRATHNVPIGELSGRRDGHARDPGRPAAHSLEAGTRQADFSAAEYPRKKAAHGKRRESSMITNI